MAETEEQLTWLQRRALKRIVKAARKQPGEPLEPEDWEAYLRFGSHPHTLAWHRVLRALPAAPRCGYCGAPFGGVGGRLVGPLGYRPSRKNPNICATCVELAPPGGMKTDAGVLFADVRGFTSRSEGADPGDVAATLRRLYGCAERTFFPEALIDKFIGDEVMALYIPLFVGQADRIPSGADERHHVAAVMLDHSRRLLACLGYGTPEGPFLEVGIGLDFGEVFVGNIGEGAVHDFTAVGDVVNTAARLQSQAAGGEVLVSSRVSAYLEDSLGPLEQLTAPGLQAPVAAHRVRWS